MAIVRKTLVPVGVHKSPNGPVNVTPKRVARWVRMWQKMKQFGILIPCPWGHQSDAVPEDEDDDDEASFRRSRYNAGYITKLFQDSDGSLGYVATYPALKADGKGNLIDPKEGTAIREVSAGIGDWKDGQGRMWRDVIVHAALTPLPVAAGQDGFQELTTTPPRSCEGVFCYFSTQTPEVPTVGVKNKRNMDCSAKDKLDSVTYKGKNLASDEIEDEELDELGDETADDGDMPLDDEMGDEGGDELDEGEADIQEELDDDEAEPVEDEMGDEGDDLDADMDMEIDDLPGDDDLDMGGLGIDEEKTQELMGLLDEVGVSLPGSTTGANLVDSLIVALTMIRSMGGRISVGGSESDMGGEEEMIAETDDVEAAPQPSMMMSTKHRIDYLLSTASPKQKQSLRNKASRKRRAVDERIKGLPKKGLPRHLLSTLHAENQRQTLSADPETYEVHRTPLERKLDVIEWTLKGLRPVRRAMMSTRAASVTENPAASAVNRKVAAQQKENASVQKMLDEYAKQLSGGKVSTFTPVE